MGLGWPERVAPRRGAAGGGLGCGGGVPVGTGGGGRVQEVQGGDAELAEGAVGREEERKRELRGSLGMGGANGRRRRLWTPRRARLGAWSREGSRGGGRRPVCAAREGRRARLERERAGEKWCTALVGSFVAVARRRQSSACAQGGSAAWRGREASQRSQGRGEVSTARGRRP